MPLYTQNNAPTIWNPDPQYNTGQYGIVDAGDLQIYDINAILQAHKVKQDAIYNDARIRCRNITQSYESRLIGSNYESSRPEVYLSPSPYPSTGVNGGEYVNAHFQGMQTKVREVFQDSLAQSNQLAQSTCNQLVTSRSVSTQTDPAVYDAGINQAEQESNSFTQRIGEFLRGLLERTVQFVKDHYVVAGGITGTISAALLFITGALSFPAALVVGGVAAVAVGCAGAIAKSYEQRPHQS